MKIPKLELPLYSEMLCSCVVNELCVSKATHRKPNSTQKKWKYPSKESDNQESISAAFEKGALVGVRTPIGCYQGLIVMLSKLKLADSIDETAQNCRLTVAPNDFEASLCSFYDLKSKNRFEMERIFNAHEIFGVFADICIGQNDDFAEERVGFTPAGCYLNLANIFCDFGYLSKNEHSFEWTNKVGPLMCAAGYWGDDLKSNTTRRREEDELFYQNQFEAMPQSVKNKFVKLLTLDSDAAQKMGFVQCLVIHWDKNEWSENALDSDSIPWYRAAGLREFGEFIHKRVSETC